MQLYELVNKYHVGTTLSCAEAMFKACNEYYGLNLPENTRKMFSIMGIGMHNNKSKRSFRAAEPLPLPLALSALLPHRTDRRTARIFMVTAW